MLARPLSSSLLFVCLVDVPLDAKPDRWAQAQVDLADIAVGPYHCDVMSDARGSSHSDVINSVDKVGPNTVLVTSDYERLPEFTTRLTRAMQTIQTTSSTPLLQVCLLDLSKNPRSLMVTVDDASWAGRKQ
ncbi:hypothetical protein KBY86_08605 [Synechococcus sp. Lug-A]|uniref:hypothetical protein n=1 Tax=Synechococcus sp. Lug-A TaxID=2823740 RepID=UPI0020CCD7B5|nr:hypothetical protein [Synechococcus sp. Lug-A]MCP9846942.1 hypothetical protein [Synechococcus sp. Lug-A]